MAPASASFQSATKALERMKDESRLNTSHGNGAGLRCGEGRNLFEALDQRSGKCWSAQRGRDGMRKKKNVSVVVNVIKSDCRVNSKCNSTVFGKWINNHCEHERLH